MSIATLNGVAVSQAAFTLPGYGMWWADVDLVEGEDLAKGTPVELALAGVTCAGTVVDGGVTSGKGAYRVVGGRGGLGRTLKRKPYLDDGGVKVSKVATDLATEAGETIGTLPTTRMGPHYARREGPAYLTLNQLAPRAWYVDFAGVIHLGTRPVTTYGGDAVRTNVDPRAGVIELAAESLEGLVPGVVVDDLAPATDVEYQLQESRLTARVFARARLNARVEAIREIVAGLFPALTYGGVWEYRVVSPAVASKRYNLQAARTATGLPDLARVPVRPGMSGLTAKIKPGALVLVVFADNDPSRPQIVAHDATDAPGWMPLELQLGDDATARGIACLDDVVQAGPYVGKIMTASARIKASR
jgi:hypothetical protein